MVAGMVCVRIFARGTDCGALGDFEEIYGSPDEDNEHIAQWDAIVTCFFIDTVGLSLTYPS